MWICGSYNMDKPRKHGQWKKWSLLCEMSRIGKCTEMRDRDYGGGGQRKGEMGGDDLAGMGYFMEGWKVLKLEQAGSHTTL